jgi:hypothetical protein
VRLRRRLEDADEILDRGPGATGPIDQLLALRKINVNKDIKPMLSTYLEEDLLALLLNPQFPSSPGHFPPGQYWKRMGPMEI